MGWLNFAGRPLVRGHVGSWRQDGPKIPLDPPKTPQIGAKMAPRPPKLEPRWPQDPPKWSQDGPKTPQLRAKMVPRPPNLEPTWPQDPNQCCGQMMNHHNHHYHRHHHTISHHTTNAGSEKISPIQVLSSDGPYDIFPMAPKCYSIEGHGGG